MVNITLDRVVPPVGARVRHAVAVRARHIYGRHKPGDPYAVVVLSFVETILELAWSWVAWSLLRYQCLALMSRAADWITYPRNREAFGILSTQIDATIEVVGVWEL